MAGRSGYVIEVPLHMSKPLHEQAPSEARQQIKTKKTANQNQETARDRYESQTQPHMVHIWLISWSSARLTLARTRVLLRTEGRSDPPLRLHAVAVWRAPQPLILQVIGMKPHSLHRLEVHEQVV